jgi:sporulation protein YlmC with PRC-barrel domain
MATMSIEQLRGKTVLDEEGQVVGSLEEVFLDTISWSVQGFRLKLKRDAARSIGASGGLLHGAVLDLPREAVRAAGDAVILSVPLARLPELADARTGSRHTPPAPAETRADHAG